MKKKILFDVLLSMLATFIPMFALQFLILPQVALRINADSYGQLIVIIAFVNLIGSTFGSVLNNSRLIIFKEYEDLEIQGDFNIILVIFILINILIMSVGLIYYGKELGLLSILMLIIVSVFLLLKTYASVAFRIKLNFKYILTNSIFLFFGYLIGYILFVMTGYWPFIYLCGFGFSVIYIIYKTDILREPFKKTPIFKKTTIKILVLLSSGMLLSLGTYLDKLLIYPLLGGAAVSVYYAATILGKTIALAIGPITGVLLSYLAHMKKFSSNNFKILLGVSGITGIIGYWSVIVISEPLLTIVYPQYVEEALNYIHITTLSIIITIMSNLVNSVLLKFRNIKWQIVINGIYVAVYISGSMVLLSLYGLMGFCIGILIASIVKLVSIITVYYINYQNYVEQKIDMKER